MSAAFAQSATSYAVIMLRTPVRFRSAGHLQGLAERIAERLLLKLVEDENNPASRALLRGPHEPDACDEPGRHPFQRQALQRKAVNGW